MADDSVTFDVQIELEASLNNLRMMLKSTDDNRQKIINFADTVRIQGDKINRTWQEIIRGYEQLTAKLSKGHQANIGPGSQKLVADAKQFLMAQDDAIAIQERLTAATKKTGNAAAEVGTKSEKAGKQAQSAFQKVLTPINAIRIALGALVSMLLFNVIQAVTNTFQTAIHNLRETELAVYNLINAERKLSELGIDITPQGLQEMIDDLRELVPILSQIDAEELVARIVANVAPSLKLTREEMDKYTKAIALAYIQNKALGYSLDEIEKSFGDSALTGKISQGLNKYGVKITDLIIKQNAVKMGLVESEEAFEALDGEMRAHVATQSLIDYAYREFSKNIQSIPEYMKTTDAAIEETSKAWSDFLTQVIIIAGPLIIDFLKFLRIGIEAMGAALSVVEPLLQRIMATLIAFENVRLSGLMLTNPIKALKLFKKTFDDVMASYERGLKNAKDTATGNPIVPEVDSEEALKNLEDIENKLEDIKKDFDNAMDDLDTKRDQKSADIDLEYIRKQADAERDLARKIEDINRDAERDIANLKEKQREDDLRAEEDYQNKLWELRMRYLLNLEDALHARDARQVIRLQREYEIDKEALERKKGMDDKQREEDQSNALEDIEIKRQERLADAQREFQEKLADQRLAKQRELDDLNVWYAREQADLREHMKRRAEELLKGWIDEGKITQENAGLIYGILKDYFGPGGLTDGLAQYMFQQLGQAAMMLGQIANMMGGAQSPRDIPRSSGGSSGEHTTGGGGRSPRIGGRGMAEGGTLLATRPTNVTFGEAGAEMATFTPLGRVGRNQGKVFGDGSGGGMDGKILVELFLSPDLEARIIDASMDGVGEIITRVTRSKV